MAIKPSLAIGLGTTTIVGGAGIIYAVNYSNTTSIEQEIQKSNRTILSQDATTWEIKLNTYNAQFKSKVNLTSKDVAGLKQWCSDTLKSNFKDNQDSNFQNAKTLCTTPTNKEKLLKEGKKLADNVDWSKKLAEYNDNSKNNNPITGIAKGTAKQNEIKEWCEKTWEEEITEGANNPYTLANKWCTKDQPAT